MTAFNHILVVKEDLIKGATAAQARAALRQYKDVMQAAERYFEGKFDHIKEGDEDFVMLDDGEATLKSRFSATVNHVDYTLWRLVATTLPDL